MARSFPVQTFTDSDLAFLPDKNILCKKFVGKKLDQLRSPGLVINEDIFKANCLTMFDRVGALGSDVRFRAHLKSHKAAEGVKLQLSSGNGAVVVSTLQEAWGCVESGLVSEGVVKEIAYGFPLPLNVISDLDRLREHVNIVVFIDHPQQVEVLDAYEQTKASQKSWRAFLKCDSGTTRAGVIGSSEQMKNLIIKTSEATNVEIHGVYTHAGESYASKTEQDASSYLAKEINAVTDGGEQVLKYAIKKPAGRIVLSVGSTPTAHVSTSKGTELGAAVQRARNVGILEIHAGNYPLLDLQQVATSLVPKDSVALSVLARVVSKYPHRDPPQALIDAGGIAFSKDLGPIPGYGSIVSPANLKGYEVVKVSQEHGVLQWKGNDTPPPELEIGTVIRILPQHACMTAAAYSWYYIVNSKSPDTVVDVWVPWKGW